jgi:hypothetical protein
VTAALVVKNTYDAVVAIFMDIIEVSLCQEFGFLKNATKYAVKAYPWCKGKE